MSEFLAGVFGIFLLFALIAGVAFAGPIYNVWVKEKNGEALLAEAEFSKKIAIEEARAKKDSASLLAEAEVERAKGVAEANRVIGESLRENEAYLRYLWIQALYENSNDVIYVPTEANLPILEATRNMQ